LVGVSVGIGVAPATWYEHRNHPTGCVENRATEYVGTIRLSPLAAFLINDDGGFEPPDTDQVEGR